MDKLFEQFIKETNTSFIRYIYTEINWKSRMIGLTYSRGIGKTTHILILQASDWNYQNTVITTIGILTSGYDH